MVDIFNICRNTNVFLKSIDEQMYLLYTNKSDINGVIMHG